MQYLRKLYFVTGPGLLTFSYPFSLYYCKCKRLMFKMNSPGKLLPFIQDCDMITNLCLADLEEYYGDVMDNFRADVENALGMLKATNTDITLINGDYDNCVCLHKAILCSQSPFLSDMLKACPDTDTIVLTEVDTGTMFHLKDILYTGSCDASSDKDKMELVKLLFRLGFSHIAKGLSVSVVNQGTKRDKAKDTNLNTLKSLNPTSTESPELTRGPVSKQKTTLLGNSPKVTLASMEEGMDDSQTQTGSKVPTSSLTSSQSQGKIIQTPTGAKKVKSLSPKASIPVGVDCPVCKHVIVASGNGWKCPLFTHMVRKHFKEELIRDYCQGPKPIRCHLCGKKEESFAGTDKRGQFLSHLGSKHCLIRNYLKLEELPDAIREALLKTKTEDNPVKSLADVLPRSGSGKKPGLKPMVDVGKSLLKERPVGASSPRIQVVDKKRKRLVPKRFSQEPEVDDAEDQDYQASSQPKKGKRTKEKSPCIYCGRVLADSHILCSHLAAFHFR